jgi:hypothetical protein
MCGFFIELIMNSNSRRELKLWQQSMDALEHEMNTTVELGISHLVIQYVVPRGTARRTSLIQRSGGIGGSNDRESVRRRVASNLDDLLDRVPLIAGGRFIRARLMTERRPAVGLNRPLSVAQSRSLAPYDLSAGIVAASSSASTFATFTQWAAICPLFPASAGSSRG